MTQGENTKRLLEKITMPHITFIHGISNKPPADELLKSWVDALASNGGVDLDQLGITYSMVYWADVMYSEPEDEDAKMQLMSLGKLPNNDPQSILSLNDWRHDVHGQDKEFLDTLQEQLLSHRTSAIEAKTEALLDNTNLALRFPIPDFAIH